MATRTISNLGLLHWSSCFVLPRLTRFLFKYVYVPLYLVEHMIIIHLIHKSPKKISLLYLLVFNSIHIITIKLHLGLLPCTDVTRIITNVKDTLRVSWFVQVTGLNISTISNDLQNCNSILPPTSKCHSFA